MSRARAPQTGDGRLDRDLRGITKEADRANARLDKLERSTAPAAPTPQRMRLASNETNGVVDGVLTALPAAGGSYVQADEDTFRGIVRDNLAELYVLVERLYQIAREKGDIE